MVVRYNPVIGVVALLLGLVVEFLGLWLWMLGEFSPAVFAGIVPALLGVLQLVRPYFRVHAGAIEVPSLIGPAKRRVEFHAIEFEGSKLFGTQPDGSRKRLPVAKWPAHPADWTEFVTFAVSTQPR